MRRLPILAAVCMLALSAAARAQVDKYNDSETAPTKRDAAEMARIRPLIEAEKLRPRIAGTWKVDHFAPVLMTANGKLPPMNAAARRLYDKRIAARKAGKSDDPIEACLPAGTPRTLFMDAPFIIAWSQLA